MTTDTLPPTRPSFGKRLLLAVKNIIIFLFKLLLTLIILGAIGAAIYFGVPVLVEEYLMRDVRTNQLAIETLNTEISQNADLVNEHLGELQARIDALEIQNDTQKQNIDDLNSQLTIAEEILALQAANQESIDSLSNLLDEYRTALSEFNADLEDQGKAISSIESEITTLEESITINGSGIEALNAAIEDQDSLTMLRHQLELLKVMELITRARVSLGQENIGLGREDLQLANELLNNLSTAVSANQAVYLSDIILRIDLASKNLAGAPGLVDKDLEVAWQSLVAGLPEKDANAEIGTDASATADADQATPTPTPTPKP